MIEHKITEDSWNDLFHATVTYFREFPVAGYGTTVTGFYFNERDETYFATITRNKKDSTIIS